MRAGSGLSVAAAEKGEKGCCQCPTLRNGLERSSLDRPSAVGTSREGAKQIHGATMEVWLENRGSPGE